VSKRSGYWECRLEGHPTVTTDQLTLDELDVAERACGIPYTLMDPHQNVRVAKALFGVMLLRAKLDAGVPPATAEDEAVAQAGQLPVGALHEAFRYVGPESPQEALVRALEDRAAAAGPPS
jgi:hypothetical protein